MEQIKRCSRCIASVPIYMYRFMIRPFLPPCCRFYPSCSAYAIEAIQKLGVIRGVFQSVKRLLRCHPWSKGGYDPLQSSKEKI